jgi:hypothetical protein
MGSQAYLIIRRSEVRVLPGPSLDTFVKTDGTWLFAERKLYADWTETCSSHT